MIGSISGLRIDQNLIPWDDLKLQGELPRKLYFPGDVNLDLAAPVLLGPNGAKLGRSDSAGGQTVAPSNVYSQLAGSLIKTDGTSIDNVPVLPVATYIPRNVLTLYSATVQTATFNSATLDGGMYVTLQTHYSVAAITGAGASMTIAVDGLSADGTFWFNYVTSGAINAVTAVGGIVNATLRNRYFRYRFTITGTTPNITYSLEYSLSN